MTPLLKESFADKIGVSRETLEALDIYLALLQRWQQKINLVGASTLEDPWRRHFLDSAQLLRFIPPRSRTLVDVGTGAGFPGLVLAIMGVPNVTLVEVDQKKVAFLREVARATETSVHIHVDRVEKIEAKPADVLTARAFAPLSRLLSWTTGLIYGNTTALLLKGRNYREELTAAEKEWSMLSEAHKSAGNDDSVILVLKGIRHVDRSQSEFPSDYRGC